MGNNDIKITDLLEELRTDTSWEEQEKKRNQVTGRLTHLLIDN